MFANEPQPELDRVKFTEKSLPDEPNSDRKLILASSKMHLRERIKKVPNESGYTLVITNTRLDKDGNVELDDNGNPIIAPAHEWNCMPEGAITMGVENIADAILKHREEAAAQAEAFFKGLDLLESVIADRV